MLRYIFYIITLLCAVPAASALTVRTTPGGLSALVDRPAEVTELSITGAVDASDLQFVAASMPALLSLDLSGATITDYDGPAVGGLTYHDAATVPAGIFAGSTIENVVFPASTVIGEAAFAGSALQQILLPGGCTICMGAFAACPSLRAVTTGGAVVGDGAFASCQALESVDLGGTTEVGIKSFANCAQLGNVSGTQSLASIGDGAFTGCRRLEQFVFGPDMTDIGAKAFANSGITLADLSAAHSRLRIGPWAFAGATALHTVSLPEVAEIGEGAFFDCTGLYRVTMPSGAILAPYSFKGASGLLAEALMTDDLKEIGPYALAGTATTRLDLPQGLSYIGSHAMAGMTALKWIGVTKLDQLPELGDDVWQGVDQPRVEVRTLGNLYDSLLAADQWRDFAIVDVTSGTVDIVPAGTGLTARFDGTMLLVDLGAADARRIDLYDIAGVHLAGAECSHRAVCAIDTSPLGTTIYLLRVQLADGSVQSLKIARQ